MTCFKLFNNKHMISSKSKNQKSKPEGRYGLKCVFSFFYICFARMPGLILPSRPQAWAKPPGPYSSCVCGGGHLVAKGGRLPRWSVPTCQGVKPVERILNLLRSVPTCSCHRRLTPGSKIITE